VGGVTVPGPTPRPRAEDGVTTIWPTLVRPRSGD
jgi:hypothetical protein